MIEKYIGSACYLILILFEVSEIKKRLFDGKLCLFFEGGRVDFCTVQYSPIVYYIPEEKKQSNE